MAKALIAVVDDDDAIRSGLSSLFRAEGYDVALFDCAEAFIASLPQGVPHCLLTDIQMPGISGLDLQARMGAEQPDLPVLIMTAFPGGTVRARALAAGAACFLSKPFDARELLLCVENALDGGSKS